MNLNTYERSARRPLMRDPVTHPQCAGVDYQPRHDGLLAENPQGRTT